MKCIKHCGSLLIICALAVPAQEIRIAGSTEPVVGQPIVLELSNDPGVNASFDWRKESGEGSFVGLTGQRVKVMFQPTKPGDTVTVVCEIRMPGREMKVIRKVIQIQEAKTSARADDTARAPVVAQVQTPVRPDATPKKAPPEAAEPKVVPRKWEAPRGSLFILDEGNVIPAGFMGDAIPKDGRSFAFLNGGSSNECHTNHGCFRVEFKPGGTEGWAAFGWQYVPDGASANWGDHPGLNLSKSNFQSLSFWARGETDGDFVPRVQFKSGGNVDPKYASSNRASYTAATPVVGLSNTWTPHCFDLRKLNLNNVVSPFTVVISSVFNPKGRTVVAFVDDVHFSPEACAESQAR